MFIYSIEVEKAYHGICGWFLMRKPFRNSERGTESVLLNGARQRTRE
jgi:hypothetical protein